jgi:hypothetical protein
MTRVRSAKTDADGRVFFRPGLFVANACHFSQTIEKIEA